MVIDTAVRRALYGKMAGDTTLTGLLATPPAGWGQSIYHAEAPAGANYPFVSFNKQAGTPIYTFKQGASALENDLWLIKAVDRADAATQAEAIAERLDALLTDGTLSISGASLMYLRRDSDIPPFREVEDGVEYQHVGALYRLIHQT